MRQIDSFIRAHIYHLVCSQWHNPSSDNGFSAMRHNKLLSVYKMHYSWDILPSNRKLLLYTFCRCGAPKDLTWTVIWNWGFESASNKVIFTNIVCGSFTSVSWCSRYSGDTNQILHIETFLFYINLLKIKILQGLLRDWHKEFNDGLPLLGTSDRNWLVYLCTNLSPSLFTASGTTLLWIMAFQPCDATNCSLSLNSTMGGSSFFITGNGGSFAQSCSVSNLKMVSSKSCPSSAVGTGCFWLLRNTMTNQATKAMNRHSAISRKRQLRCSSRLVLLLATTKFLGPAEHSKNVLTDFQLSRELESLEFGQKWRHD